MLPGDGVEVDVEFGLQVHGDYADVLQAVRFAEEHGCVAVSLIDHYLMSEDEVRAGTMPALDAFVQLGGLSRDSTEVELSTMVSPVTFRHPGVIAKTAVTLDELSAGRFKLGVGAGWFEREHEIFGLPFPGVRERFDLLEETLGYLRAAFDPNHPGYRGKRLALEAFPLVPTPQRAVPILIGGGGPHRTPYLAGTYADEYNIVEIDTFDQLHLRIDRAHEAAVAAGRDPQRLLLSVNRTPLGADTVSELNGKLDESAHNRGLTRAELQDQFARREFLVAGTWDQIAAEFDRYARSGISRIYFSFWDQKWDSTTPLEVMGKLARI